MNLLCLRAVQWLSLGVGGWMTESGAGGRLLKVLEFCIHRTVTTMWSAWSLIIMVIVRGGTSPSVVHLSTGWTFAAQERVQISCLVLEFLIIILEFQINCVWVSWFVWSEYVQAWSQHTWIWTQLSLWPWANNRELQFLHLWDGDNYLPQNFIILNDLIWNA